MKFFKELLPRGGMLLVIFTLVCGVFYTLFITGFAQLLFPNKANGSIIQVDGKNYGSELLAQNYSQNDHMWGRIMKVDVSTFVDESGTPLMYASPSNLSPASEEFAQLVAERVALLQGANPEMKDIPIPVDLVTGSGSGLDPHVSPAAAEYQVARLAKENGKTEEEITAIIKKCTTAKFLGLFGEETVNVLKVNLMLEGILE